MADGLIDVAVNRTIIKQIGIHLYDQYHVFGCGVGSILLRELISLKQLKCENTDSYFAKFQVFYLRLSNICKKLDN